MSPRAPRAVESDYVVDLPAAVIATRLIGTLRDFDHLALACPAILYVRSRPALYLHGAKANACIGPARVQAVAPLAGLWTWLLDAWRSTDSTHDAGTTGDVTDGIEFLCFLDAAVWDELEEVGRERLVYHELCHLKQKADRDGNPKVDGKGRPVLALVPHDYEFFDAEVRRYGPEVCGLEALDDTLKAGRRAVRPRTLRRA